MATHHRRLDFFFDYLSPYAYLASLDAPELCRRHHVSLHFRPVLFAGLLGHWGQLGPAEIPPKGRHAFRDCLRHATLRGIPLRSPRNHPFRPLLALRLSLPSVAQADQARVIRTLFAHGWAEGGDLGDESEIRSALAGAGLDADTLLARASSESVKRELRDETEEAVSRDVFGIPTMIVDRELFWGFDQLPHLGRFLAGRDPLAGIDVSTLRSHGRGAWRSGIPRRE